MERQYLYWDRPILLDRSVTKIQDKKNIAIHYRWYFVSVERVYAIFVHMMEVHDDVIKW